MAKTPQSKSTIILLFLSSLTIAPLIFAHCQIPCGIYDDGLRFTMIAENITSIEKSMKQIVELSKEAGQNLNQIVRWVQTKEKHADDTSYILTQYFLTQRLNPADKSDPKAYDQYVNKLTLLHQMLIYSMKAKQTTDLTNVEKLRALLADFRAAYYGTTISKGRGHHRHDNNDNH